MTLGGKPRGGKREGAGRKKLSNRYKEQTHPIRVPYSLLPMVQTLLQNKVEKSRDGDGNIPFLPHPSSFPVERPMFQDAVSAGTPFTAADHVDNVLDLNTYLVSNPNSTFFVRVAGDSMTGANIFDGDLLVVDRNPTPKARDIVIAVVDGDLTVKRYMPTADVVVLQAENPDYQNIYIQPDQNFTIWGVVMHTIHKAH